MNVSSKDDFKKRAQKGKKAYDALMPEDPTNIEIDQDSIEEIKKGNANGIANNSTSVIINEKERRLLELLEEEEEEKETFESKYIQQNVYIERQIKKEIDDILREKKRKGVKLTKKDIYNQALRMYLMMKYDRNI